MVRYVRFSRTEVSGNRTLVRVRVRVRDMDKIRDRDRDRDMVGAWVRGSSQGIRRVHSRRGVCTHEDRYEVKARVVDVRELEMPSWFILSSSSTTCKPRWQGSAHGFMNEQ